MKLVKACLPLVFAALWVACQSGGFQPVVIDLSAPTQTPAAGATSTPAPGPPSPTPTFPPPQPSPTPAPRIAAAPPPPPTSAPMQPQPVPPPDVRAAKAGSPEAVVEARIDAYNRRDLDKLLSLYSPDVRVFDPPDRLRDSGADQVRQSYVRRFASAPRGRVESAGRMTSGNFVVERETETAASGAPESSIVIREVLDGKIVRVWILR